jgi:uncharacterized protein
MGRPRPAHHAARAMDVAGGEHRRVAQAPQGLDHQPGEVAAGAAAHGDGLGRRLHAGLVAGQVVELVVDGAVHPQQEVDRGLVRPFHLTAQPAQQHPVLVLGGGDDERVEHRAVLAGVDDRRDGVGIVDAQAGQGRGEAVDDQAAGDGQAVGLAPRREPADAIAHRVVGPAGLARQGGLQRGVADADGVAVARPDQQPMRPEADWPGVAVSRFVKDAEPRHWLCITPPNRLRSVTGG